MRKRLWEISQQTPVDRVIFLGQKADVIGQRQQTLEQRVGVFAAPL